MRECPEGTGHVFLARAHRGDRGALPRRHPGVRSVRTHEAPETSYGRLPVWRSRRHWLEVVVLLAATERAEVLARHRVSIEGFCAWAKAESLYAAPATGRRCIVRPDTVASLLEVSTRTVQRCRAAARELGLLVDVVKGRMLSAAECFQARAQGSPQRGMANESALTVPAWLGADAWSPCGSASAPEEDLAAAHDAGCGPHRGPGPRPAATRPVVRPAARAVGCSVDGVTPTSGKAQQIEELQDIEGFPRGANGESDATPSRRHRARRADRTPSPGWVQNRLSRAAARALAAQLLTRVPWLHREHPQRLVPLLTRFTRGALPWTADDVIEHIRRVDARRQQPAFTADRIRTRPAIILARYLRDVDVQADHPRTHILAWLDEADHAHHHATPTGTPPTRTNQQPPQPTRPPWCGHCDEHTRHLQLADGRAARCRRCHPAAAM